MTVPHGDVAGADTGSNSAYPELPERVEIRSTFGEVGEWIAPPGRHDRLRDLLRRKST
jgi:hypothetical protein